MSWRWAHLAAALAALAVAWWLATRPVRLVEGTAPSCRSTADLGDLEVCIDGKRVPLMDAPWVEAKP